MGNQAGSDEQFVYTFHNELPPSQVSAFAKLQEELDRAASLFEGYLGQELDYEPSDQQGLTRCVARIRFTSLENCLAWLDSRVRRRLLVHAEEAIGYRYRSLVEPQSFDQWITSRSGQKPPAWKVNLLVWLALYPSVMILMMLGRTTLGRMPLPLNMLISNAITVAVTGWLLVPWLSRLYANWLNASSGRSSWLYCASALGFLLLFLVVFSSPVFSF